MNIHIVEDDYGVRDALSEFVCSLGFSARSYEDGEAFLRAAPPLESDIVFVDLGLPGMSGTDVIRWIEKQRDPPRVVAISGQPRRDIDAMLREMPTLALIRKPLEADAITAYL